jgi:hypothetical protein
MGSLQDAFLVSAVTMILIIRFQLWLTNYPQLGGGNLHIAHLLWGGLFMLVALGMLLSFVGPWIRFPAAIVGGVGFGFFIDELGKFITSDNDYFFQPAAAIIYLVFVVLYLLTRWMQNRRGLSQSECLVNAVDMLTEAAERGFDEHEKRRALELLAQADPANPLTGELRSVVERIETTEARQPGRAVRVAERIRQAYARLVEHRRFAWIVSAVFVVWAAISLVAITFLAIAAALTVGGVSAIDIAVAEGDHLSFINYAGLASSVVSGALVISGVLRMRRGRRLEAYRQFDRALMVAILIGAFFSFIEIQFSAVFGLAANILLLITVRLMIDSEEKLQAASGVAARASRPPAGAYASS